MVRGMTGLRSRIGLCAYMAVLGWVVAAAPQGAQAAAVIYIPEIGGSQFQFSYIHAGSVGQMVGDAANGSPIFYMGGPLYFKIHPTLNATPPHEFDPNSGILGDLDEVGDLELNVTGGTVGLQVLDENTHALGAAAATNPFGATVAHNPTLFGGSNGNTFAWTMTFTGGSMVDTTPGGDNGASGTLSYRIDGPGGSFSGTFHIFDDTMIGLEPNTLGATTFGQTRIWANNWDASLTLADIDNLADENRLGLDFGASVENRVTLIPLPASSWVGVSLLGAMAVVRRWRRK